MDEQVAVALHPARFATYLASADGDLNFAMQLYLWNSKLSAAFQMELGHFEVLFRNAVDLQLRDWNVSQISHLGATHSTEWLIDPARPLNSMLAKVRGVAMTNAKAARASRPPRHPRKFAPISHDDLLAQLTFGTIVRLMPTADVQDKNFRARQILWAQAINQAFPYLVNDPDGHNLVKRLSRVHALRNRVAHMEPLLSVNVAARHRDMIKIIGAINPQLQGWFSGVSIVREVERQRPSGL